MEQGSAGMREASVIELHEAGVILIAEDTSPERAGWTDDFWNTRTSYAVEGPDIKTFLQFLGLSVQPLREYNYTEQKEEQRHINEEDFVIKQRRHMVEVDQLQARVDGPHLLFISVELNFSDTPGTFVRELTYSGTYTVWWK